MSPRGLALSVSLSHAVDISVFTVLNRCFAGPYPLKILPCVLAGSALWFDVIYSVRRVVVFCLAFPSDLEADVSNGILLKILTLIKSTQRFVTGHLEVIDFVTLGENADFGSPSPLVNLQGKPETIPRMSQCNEMSRCGSLQI